MAGALVAVLLVALSFWFLRGRLLRAAVAEAVRVERERVRRTHASLRPREVWRSGSTGKTQHEAQEDEQGVRTAERAARIKAYEEIQKERSA